MIKSIYIKYNVNIIVIYQERAERTEIFCYQDPSKDELELLRLKCKIYFLFSDTKAIECYCYITSCLVEKSKIW